MLTVTAWFNAKFKVLTGFYFKNELKERILFFKLCKNFIKTKINLVKIILLIYCFKTYSFSVKFGLVGHLKFLFLKLNLKYSKSLFIF